MTDRLKLMKIKNNNEWLIGNIELNQDGIIINAKDILHNIKYKNILSIIKFNGVTTIKYDNKILDIILKDEDHRFITMEYQKEADLVIPIIER